MILKKILLFFVFLSFFIETPIADPGYKVRLFDLLFVFSLILFAFSISQNKKGFKFDKFFLFFFLFSIFNVVSIIWGASVGSGIKEFIQFMEMLLFIIIFCYFFQNVKFKDIIILFYLSAFFGMLLYLGLILFSGDFIGNKEFNGRWIPGLLASLTFGFYLISTSLFQRNIFLVIFVLLILFTLITLERKSWIGMLISVISMYYFYHRKIKETNIFSFGKLMRPAIVVLGGISIVVLLYFNNEMVNKQLDSLSQAFYLFEGSIDEKSTTYSNKARFYVLTEGYDFFKESPILGIGTQNFNDKYERRSGYSIGGAHNEFLRILVELGIIGFVLFIGVVFYSIRPIYGKGVSYRSYSVFIIGIWSFAIVFLFFRASNLINYLLLIVPYLFSIIYVNQNNKEKTLVT